MLFYSKSSSNSSKKGNPSSKSKGLATPMPGSNKSFIRARKEDALALAELAYDIFKEEDGSGNIVDGQNNAQTSSS